MRRKSMGLVLAMVCLLAVVEVFPQGGWNFASHLPTHGRAGLAVTNGKDGMIYAIGGLIIGDPNIVGTTEAYNPRTNVWTVKAPMPTVRRSAAAATAPNGLIYVFGGCPEDHGYTPMNLVEVYNPATNTWTTGTPMPIARTGHKAITAPNGLIYVIGGYRGGPPDGTPGNQYGHTGLVDVFNPATNTWTTAAPMPTPRQEFGATLGADGRIYVVGGSDQWRTGLKSVVEVYNPATNTWTTVAPMTIARDGVGAATGPDGLIYAAGGFSYEVGQFGDVTASVEAYNPATNTWSRQPSMLLPEYSPGTITGMDCRVYAIGGGGWGTSAYVQYFEPMFSAKRSKKCLTRL